MGALLYGSHEAIDFDDRVLAHLQIVVGAKLRRREGFFLTWRDESHGGVGWSTIWIDPSISLMFRYETSASKTIDRAWLDELTAASNTARGLIVTGEPARRATAAVDV